MIRRTASGDATLNTDGSVNLERIGLDRELAGDLYHRLLSLRWGPLFLVVAAGYLAANSLFALGYLAGGSCLDNARPGSFADAFFFSVQTMATVGYGNMSPRTTYANLLVTAETLVGVLGFAMATGLFFSKFARPTARVLFSRRAVVQRRGGTPYLVFRMANQRSNHIVEAQLRLTLVRWETWDGEPMRRFYELDLVRWRHPVLALTWTAFHRIDPSSPLYGATASSLAEADAGIIASLVGTDDTFFQAVHARHAYRAADVVFEARLTDVLVTLSDGRRAVDFRRFHDVEEQPPTA
jgi:inward rectifier potassium channel